MHEFGYSINTNNQVDLDVRNLNYLQKISEIEPSFKFCIACGTCTGGCSAGNFTQFNLRKIITLFSRGEYKNLKEELSKCMLCGKCMLICPRGVNTRNVIANLNKLLKN